METGPKAAGGAQGRSGVPAALAGKGSASASEPGSPGTALLGPEVQLCGLWPGQIRDPTGGGTYAGGH